MSIRFVVLLVGEAIPAGRNTTHGWSGPGTVVTLSGSPAVGGGVKASLVRGCAGRGWRSHAACSSVPARLSNRRA